MNNSSSEDSATQTPQRPRSKALLAWMIVSQLLGLPVILLGAAFWVFGLLLGSGAFSFSYLAIYLSPAIMLIPLVGSWFAYGKRNEKLAWILTSLPLLYICLDLMMVFVWTLI